MGMSLPPPYGPELSVINQTAQVQPGTLTLAVSPQGAFGAAAVLSREVELPPGESVLELILTCAEPPRLWDCQDPNLYLAETVLAAAGPEGGRRDCRLVRFGFRDFRFANGCFQLNGRRLFLRSSHTGNHLPYFMDNPTTAELRDLLRRDLLYAKAAGYNAIRFLATPAQPFQLDLCDELGLMVWEEHPASWMLEDSPQMAARYDRSLRETLWRDRNHACITMWGLLNETSDGPVFRHALAALPLVRELDETRLVFLNSWMSALECLGHLGLGTVSNPGSREWENLLSDRHHYLLVPHPRGELEFLRNLSDDLVRVDVDWLRLQPNRDDLLARITAAAGGPVELPETGMAYLRAGPGKRPVFLSEYGVGSPVDVVRAVKHYQQRGIDPEAEDFKYYRGLLEKFMADWRPLALDRIYARPEDFFRDCLARHSRQRLLGLNAIRSNPNLAGYSLTGTVDQGCTGEGQWTTWREFKPGIMDVLQDGLAPLRWCLFAEPVHGYRGDAFTLEAVLAHEAALPPGEYPVVLKVVGPGGTVWEKRAVFAATGHEPGMATPVFAETVTLDVPEGSYELVADVERGLAPAGGHKTFYVADPAVWPAVAGEVAVWGGDDRLESWLTKRGICWHRQEDGGRPRHAATPVILVGEDRGAGDWPALLERIEAGSIAIFLCPEVFRDETGPLGRLPLGKKGALVQEGGSVYHRDDFARKHPIFDGLPSGGVLDYEYYRELLERFFVDQDSAERLDVVAATCHVGACMWPEGYRSGTLISVHGHGRGRFVLNALRIVENLGRNPAADRLLLNLVRLPTKGEVR